MNVNIKISDMLNYRKIQNTAVTCNYTFTHVVSLHTTLVDKPCLLRKDCTNKSFDSHFVSHKVGELMEDLKLIKTR